MDLLISPDCPQCGGRGTVPLDDTSPGLNVVPCGACRARWDAAHPPLVFRYRNHRSEVATRRCRNPSLTVGRSEQHPGIQWLLRGFDLDRDADRFYAVSGILGWEPYDHPVAQSPSVAELARAYLAATRGGQPAAFAALHDAVEWALGTRA